MNSLYGSQQSKGWDDSSQLLSAILSPTGGFSTPFSIDALNFTIPEEKENESMVILDIAAGTGPLSLYAQTKYKNSKFITTDFSPKMLEFLEKYIKENNISNIDIKVMDGQNLESIQDNIIDYTFSIFGLIFFPNRIQGMKEMYRVLKPNGKTSIASWCDHSFLPYVFQLTMNELLGNDSYKQVKLSLSNPVKFESELKEAGFKNIEIKQVQHPMEIFDIKNLAKMMKTNPAYLDGINLLSDDKKQLFDETFTKYAIKEHDPKRNSKNKIELKSYSLIGIGEK